MLIENRDQLTIMIQDGATNTVSSQLVDLQHPEAIYHVANGFLLDRKSQGVSSNTIRIYSHELRLFIEFLNQQSVNNMNEMTAHVIRQYMIDLQNQGRNEGGRHIAYRVIKSLNRWWERETDGDYKNPMWKVTPPKIDKDKILDPVSVEDVQKLAAAAEGLHAARDKAIVLCLLDTGCRANEFVSIDLADIDLITGELKIRHGKGNKERSVFIGKKARRAMRAYLKSRKDDSPFLWVTMNGYRLKYSGLRQIIRRLSARANISTPALHSFRRAFSIEMLRAGVDLITIQRLLGHADLQVIRRYTKQNNEDLRNGHLMGSPVDRKII